MKKIIITALSLLVLFHFGLAQSCDQFLNATNGKKLVYSNSDAKGNQTGQITYTSVKKDASTITIHSDITDKNGKAMGSSDFDITCNGSSINIDMRSFMPANGNKQMSNMQMQADGKYLSYPLTLNTGEKLEDGSMVITILNNGEKFGETHMDITNRNVVLKETISTPAGDFECFKITYDARMETKMMGIGIPVTMQSIEWFSPRLGRFIKSESYNKNGKLMGTTALVAIN
ncbi:hypothetical protein [Mucilaginibacter sp.]|uniref:TapB family protein n=1 Tax=Mucilaginibacter sp. TaxID=1882438 RepID=UPI002849AB28|nr:hypothetical protein [Mucilaginibacter sp.]MDR3693636.1 hypothetical protein [Mucilaginibacter sp.]